MIFNDLDKLQKVIEHEKKEGKKIIWTNGCFDIMHPGHMKTFKVCRDFADIVVVGMNGDLSPYWKTKPGRPINNEVFRGEMLTNLKNVDYIYVFNDETPIEAVSKLKPNFILKGGEYIQESIKGLVKHEKSVLNLTNAYKSMINNGIEKFRIEKGFLPEGEIVVKNGGDVIIVPIVSGCSTTNIINKIK